MFNCSYLKAVSRIRNRLLGSEHIFCFGSGSPFFRIRIHKLSPNAVAVFFNAMCIFFSRSGQVEKSDSDLLYIKMLKVQSDCQ